MNANLLRTGLTAWILATMACAAPGSDDALAGRDGDPATGRTSPGAPTTPATGGQAATGSNAGTGEDPTTGNSSENPSAPTGPADAPPPSHDDSLLHVAVAGTTSSTVTLSWVAPEGAGEVRVFLAPEPGEGDSPMPAEVRVADAQASATGTTIPGLAPGVDVFFRVETDVPGSTVVGTAHARTVGGPRATLDDAVREVHFAAPGVLQVVLAGGDGAAWQDGEWTVEGVDGAPIAVRRVHRHSVPVGAPRYQVGYQAPYSDEHVDVDHRIHLVLDAAAVASPSVLRVTGPEGVFFTLPFSDRWLPTPSIQLNQVGYNPEATQRFAYVSGWIGDGGALPLDTFPGAAEVLSEKADGSGPRTTLATGLSLKLRASGDEDAGADVAQVDLSSVPAAEGVRYFVRLPGVGVSWPTQVSRAAVFKSFYTVTRGLFFNRWGGDVASVCTTLPRKPDHRTVYTAELQDFDRKFDENTPRAGERTLVGGYHDAGDFDQRPMHTVVPQLLMRAFELDPARHVDGQLTLPESGNGIPDLLDEALWGVRAWEQLQEDDGGVRQGVETFSHPKGIYFADEDPMPFWTYARSPLVSARAAGLFAQAARLVKPFDADRSANLAERASRAFQYARTNGATPAFLLYAAGELLQLTGDDAYRQAFDEAWDAMGPYGAFSNFSWTHLSQRDYKEGARAMPDYVLGYARNPAATPAIRDAIVAQVTKAADDAVAALDANHAHRNPRPDGFSRNWGYGTGTARFLDPVIARLQLGDVDAARRQKYVDALSLGADYVLGGNPDGTVYFTLLGSRPVREPLHLDSLSFIAQGRGPMPGIPVFGPVDDLPEMPWTRPTLAQFHPAVGDHPAMRRYGDVRTLVEANEFTVWETQAPFAQLFAVQVVAGMQPPADWQPGGAGHHAMLP